MLVSAIAGAGRRDEGGRLLVTRPSGARPYFVRVLASGHDQYKRRLKSPTCAVHLHALAIERPPGTDALRQIFGLTTREADLAVALVATAHLRAAAARSRMAINTARNHLRGIFMKTATTNQIQAVQLLSQVD